MHVLIFGRIYAWLVDYYIIDNTLW